MNRHHDHHSLDSRGLGADGRGPGNGQYALQKALRQYGPPWLTIGGGLRRGEIPWFWCWEDREVAASCARVGAPFVAGPNILFANSRAPCRFEAERAICNAASCRLLFTESEWYRRLIRRHLGPANRAPIVLWPYPIDPCPGGPLPPQLDLLIYEKSGIDAAVVASLQQAWPRHARVRYGRYRREQLWALARRRAAVFTSPTTIAGRWPWPKYCWPAVRRSAFRVGRRSSSPAAPACCWRG